jgi:hypothetical protein
MSTRSLKAFTAAGLLCSALGSAIPGGLAAAQSPVVQPQYFGAAVSPITAVELSTAASRPLGQPAFTAEAPVAPLSGGSATYGQRIQSDLSPATYTGLGGSTRSSSTLSGR